MKKIIVSFSLLLMFVLGVKAQKVALLDMDYIMKNIPAYQSMTQQLEEQSKVWQSEVTNIEKQVRTMYQNFQNNTSFLSADQKKQQENAIVAKEKQAYELKRKYFGPQGELFKKREALMKPIQNQVWNILKKIAQKNGYQVIIDRSSSKIIYADPAIDISGTVLNQLGYSANNQ